MLKLTGAVTIKVKHQERILYTKSVLAKEVRKDGYYFMSSNKVEFRIPKEQFEKLRRNAQGAGISVNLAARELILRSLEQKEMSDSDTCNDEIMPSDLRIRVNKGLSELEYYVENLPNNTGCKMTMKERVEEIWLLLN